MIHRLRAENVKLNYRLGILKRAVEKEESAKPRKPVKRAMEKPDYTGKMKSMLAMLTAEFRSALEKAFPDLPDAPCPVVRSSKQGDYQFNGAMAIAGILKVQFTVHVYFIIRVTKDSICQSHEGSCAQVSLDAKFHQILVGASYLSLRYS